MQIYQYVEESHLASVCCSPDMILVTAVTCCCCAHLLQRGTSCAFKDTKTNNVSTYLFLTVALKIKTVHNYTKTEVVKGKKEH